MEKIKRIALVAHDNRKKDLIEWAEWNYSNSRSSRYKFICHHMWKNYEFYHNML